MLTEVEACHLISMSPGKVRKQFLYFCAQCNTHMMIYRSSETNIQVHLCTQDNKPANNKEYQLTKGFLKNSYLAQFFLKRNLLSLVIEACTCTTSSWSSKHLSGQKEYRTESTHCLIYIICPSLEISILSQYKCILAKQSFKCAFGWTVCVWNDINVCSLSLLQQTEK